MSERRTNQPIREQAQKWFEALRTHLGAENAQADLAEGLQRWKTIEHLMTERPALVPPLMTMAWQLRREPAFADLFQTNGGKVAEDSTTTLVPCGKSFDEVVLLQLHGAMRLYCLRQERTWLAAEKARYRPSALENIWFIAFLMRRLKRRRDSDILANYPQRGLFLALKPYLRRPSQFTLIEALATLPTRTVSMLRDNTRGLNHDAAIRNLAALEIRKCKFVAQLARDFAEAVIENAQAGGRDISGPTIVPPPARENLAEITGIALSHLTRDGLHQARAAIAVREQAHDIVMKMAVPLGYGVWNAFADAEGAMNIAHCPTVLARAIGENAARVMRRTSDALNTIPDQSVLEAVLTALLKAAGREDAAKWATSPLCVTAWERLANDFKQAVTKREDAALSPDAITAYCAQIVPKFVALLTEPAPAVAAEPAPEAAVAQGA